LARTELTIPLNGTASYRIELIVSQATIDTLRESRVDALDDDPRHFRFNDLCSQSGA
jgi:hypothetical protein